MLSWMAVANGFLWPGSLIDWSYGEDRDEVTGAETVVAGGVSQSPVDPLCPVESGQSDRFSYRDPGRSQGRVDRALLGPRPGSHPRCSISPAASLRHTNERWARRSGPEVSLGSAICPVAGPKR